MRKNILVLVMVGLFVLIFQVSIFASDIVWRNISRENLNLRTVLVNPYNSGIIYVGSNNAILKTEDAGESWRSILSVRGDKRGINFLLFDPQDKNSLYAATAGGFFYSPNLGGHWKRIFQGKNTLENECTTIAILPDGIYLGTKNGLFVSKDKGRCWHKEIGELGTSHILVIAYNLKEPSYAECSYSGRNTSTSRSSTSQNNDIRDLYLACIDGVFRTQDAGKTWERIFVANPTEDVSETDEALEDQDEAERISDIRYISIDPNNSGYLYLATSQGVYKSQDRGKTWNLLSSYGLLNQDVKFLLVSAQSNLYATTKSGIFEYRDERWYELSLGLVAEDVRFLTLDNQNNLYTASDKGLFKANIGYHSNATRSESIIALYYKDEPKINEVQQAAIRYAEVEPDKIKSWRKQAAKKALLPKLTVGLDNSKNTNYEIYTSATTHYVYEGPNDRSSGWDVTLSWDLSEIVWNDDQTNIDVRSRLMVQLRDDILDEVTKLYFERLRVKMELDSLSIEDRKKRWEKELKLQELTASLDALTGGYFSQSIKTSPTS